MGWGLPEVNVGTKYNATGKSSQQEAAEREAARRAEQQRAAIAAAQAEYNRRLAEQAQRIREIYESAERTQLMRGPEPQAIGPAAAPQDERKRKMGSSRGSLLAGNTGGYNPATGGGRLGGMMRSLLG